MDSGCGAIVSGSAMFALCTGELVSVTWKVSEAAVTVTVGVPEIAPVAAFSFRPAGNVPPIRGAGPSRFAPSTTFDARGLRFRPAIGIAGSS